MLELGAKTSLMSGSGPSVFGLFESSDQRDAAYNALIQTGVRAYPCDFIN